MSDPGRSLRHGGQRAPDIRKGAKRCQYEAPAGAIFPSSLTAPASPATAIGRRLGEADQREVAEWRHGSAFHQADFGMALGPLGKTHPGKFAPPAEPARH